MLAAVAFASAAGGCGFGAGDETEGEASLRVTRDYGTELIAEATEPSPSESDTVIKMLDRETEIETRYGGGFVQSIEGLSGTVEDGRSADWFFYVDGIESPVGSADVAVEPGARIWWDYHDWTDVMRVPAVVGSWPEPLAQRGAEAPDPVVLQCEGPTALCDEADERLADAGITTGEGERQQTLRVLVGAWDEVRAEPAARLLAPGPVTSGVFARFERDGGEWALHALDDRGDEARVLEGGAGLVAAVRDGDAPPTWIVTGTDEEGALAAAQALGEEGLRDRYAIAVEGNEVRGLPVIGAE
jgi:hypothetical protein